MSKILILLFLVSFNSFALEVTPEMVEAYKNFNNAKVTAIEQMKDDFIGVELIVAAEGEGIASQFGHSLIRLVDNDDYWTNDVVISFGGFIDEATINNIKGLIGSYSIYGEIKNFYEYWEQYAKTENRSLDRYIIPLTKNELDSFVTTLIKYLRNPQMFGNYRFLTNNCASSVTEIFNQAGITINNDGVNIPTNTDKWLDENRLSPYAPLVISSPKKLFEKLNAEEIYKLNFAQIKDNYNEREIYYIYSHFHKLKPAVLVAMREHLKASKVDLDETLQLKKFPSVFYSKCQSSNCFKELSKQEESYLSDRERSLSYLKRQYIDNAYFAELNGHAPYTLVDRIPEELRSVKTIKNFALVLKGNEIKLKVVVKRERKNKKTQSSSRAYYYSLPFSVTAGQIYFEDEVVGSINMASPELSNMFVVPHLSSNKVRIDIFKLK